MVRTKKKGEKSMSYLDCHCQICPHNFRMKSSQTSVRAKSSSAPLSWSVAWKDITMETLVKCLNMY